MKRDDGADPEGAWRYLTAVLIAAIGAAASVGAAYVTARKKTQSLAEDRAWLADSLRDVLTSSQQEARDLQARVVALIFASGSDEIWRSVAARLDSDAGAEIILRRFAQDRHRKELVDSVLRGLRIEEGQRAELADELLKHMVLNHSYTQRVADHVLPELAEDRHRRALVDSVLRGLAVEEGQRAQLAEELLGHMALNQSYTQRMADTLTDPRITGKSVDAEEFLRWKESQESDDPPPPGAHTPGESTR
ncbi:MAG TPA: hypothetical protein VHG91_08240 [Longimicrobium sp.]|nr:hypothetical protein [Longimicrobium sp.]